MTSMLSTMPSHVELSSPVERQLLVQLGERIRRMREAQGKTATSLAQELGISRTTLHAAESGDPATSMGTYMRVLGALGRAGDVALIGTPDAQAWVNTVDALLPTLVDATLKSMALHVEAVRLLSLKPALANQADELFRSLPPSKQTPELREVFMKRAWADLVAPGQSGERLRDASPLPRLVPEANVNDVVARFAKDEARRRRVLLQAEQAIKALGDIGVKAELVGSLIWGQFKPHSDVDVLILERGHATDGDIYGAVMTNIKDAESDLVFWDSLPDSSKLLIDAQRQRVGRRSLTKEIRHRRPAP